MNFCIDRSEKTSIRNYAAPFSVPKYLLKTVGEQRGDPILCFGPSAEDLVMKRVSHTVACVPKHYVPADLCETPHHAYFPPRQAPSHRC